MKNTSTIKKTSGLLVATLLLLMACDKQGPMGPEGPPGPDGENAGSGGGNFTTYLTEPDHELHWYGIDGWHDYVVYHLNIDSHIYPDLMPLPDTAASMIENGGLILAYLKIEGVWRSLPFKDVFHNGDGRYEYYFNYEVNDGKIAITAKVFDDVESSIDEYIVERVKIVVAPASVTVPLKL